MTRKTATRKTTDRGQRVEEAVRVLDVVLRANPPEQWPAKRLRMILQADREMALRRAYAVGMEMGIAEAQDELATNPRRLAEIRRVVMAGQQIPVPLIGHVHLNSSDFANLDEWMAASGRYGVGFGLGYIGLITRRLVLGNSPGTRRKTNAPRDVA